MRGRIGYACLNYSIGATVKTFRLASYSEARLMETIDHNLASLERALEYNVQKGIGFFRISSQLIPFASHPVCQLDWASRFRSRFQRLGSLIKESSQRISMHPDQFTLINAPERRVVEASVRELEYHARVLDLLNLDMTAKIQIHVGGLYGDRRGAIRRFLETYATLSPRVRGRLVIENDDRLFSLKDTLEIHRSCGVPVLFDTFHHELLNHGESLEEALDLSGKTWLGKWDGVPMIDYSSQAPGARPGKHADTLDPDHFIRIVKGLGDRKRDIMLEIRDKEKSAHLAMRRLRGHTLSGIYSSQLGQVTPSN